jgi:hypothetical protein
MSALPGIIGLLVFVYAHPQDILPGLRGLDFLHLFLGLTVAGIAHDVWKRRTVLMSTPLLPWVAAFSAWCLLGLLVRAPDTALARSVPVGVSFVLYAVLAHGVQQLRPLRAVLAVLLTLGLFVAAVGAHQGLSPTQCTIYDPSDRNGLALTDGRACELLEADGTPHEGTLDCIAEGNPGTSYACERVGLFGTTSVGGGRVRYLGVLLDPNELALATAIAVPFAFALVEIRRSALRVLLLLGALAVVAAEIVFTRSRGGQATFAAVLGAYFVKRFGVRRGLVAAVIMAIPMLLAGGRADEDSQASTLERLGCAAAGIRMLVTYPLTGVGYSRFTEHHGLTAHNAYILAAGELGLPGMWLFTSLLLLSCKIPLTVLRLPRDGTPESRALAALAMGLLAAFAGAAVGVYFLSWTYHYVLWIHFGLAGALFAVAKRRHPTLACRLTRVEKACLFLGCVAYLAVWAYYIRRRGAWE